MTRDARYLLNIEHPQRRDLFPGIDAVVLDTEFAREGDNAPGLLRHSLNDLAHVDYGRISLQQLSIAYGGANFPTFNKKL